MCEIDDDCCDVITPSRHAGIPSFSARLDDVGTAGAWEGGGGSGHDLVIVHHIPNCSQAATATITTKRSEYSETRMWRDIEARVSRAQRQQQQQNLLDIRGKTGGTWEAQADATDAYAGMARGGGGMARSGGGMARGGCGMARGSGGGMGRGGGGMGRGSGGEGDGGGGEGDGSGGEGEVVAVGEAHRRRSQE